MNKKSVVIRESSIIYMNQIKLCSYLEYNFSYHDYILNKFNRSYNKVKRFEKIKNEIYESYDLFESGKEILVG